MIPSRDGGSRRETSAVPLLAQLKHDSSRDARALHNEFFLLKVDAAKNRVTAFDSAVVGFRHPQRSEELPLHSGKHRREGHGRFLASRQGVASNILEQVDHPSSRRTTSGSALGVQRQALDPLAPHCLPKIALQQRLHPLPTFPFPSVARSPSLQPWLAFIAVCNPGVSCAIIGMACSRKFTAAWNVIAS